MRTKIAVLIPCYNEAQTIEKVIREYREALPAATIYVYDNNSTDQTAAIAAEAGAVVRREPRQGKGNVIRTMFREIDADCYLMVDGDDTYPADCAREMCEMVLSGTVDMVVGDRLSSTYFQENKRPFHNVGNRSVRFLINQLFHSNICDIMSGQRAFSKLFVKTYPLLARGFEVETEMTIHALDKNFIVKEIPIAYRDRPEGSVSKLNTFRDGIKVLGTITELFREYRPFAFFNTVSIVLWLLALGFFLPVLAEYLRTGQVLRFPTVIVCGVVAVFGILLWTCGVILEVVIKKHRQLYELELVQMNELIRREEK